MVRPGTPETDGESFYGQCADRHNRHDLHRAALAVDNATKKIEVLRDLYNEAKDNLELAQALLLNAAQPKAVEPIMYEAK